MKRFFAAIATITMVAGLGLVTGVQPAAAGCQLNVRVVNDDPGTIYVDWADSKVKIKYGTWKKLGSSTVAIAPGSSFTENYAATFNCGTKRRYQITATQNGQTKTVYHPSTTGWTTNQTVTVHMSIP